jgi:type I restriction enzyme S subunit
MAKISYIDHIKKNSVAVVVSEIIFKYLLNNYKTVQLKDVISTSSGGTPNRSMSEYYNGEIPWLKSGEVNDSIIKTCEEFITDKGLQNSSAKIFPQGTLVVAMYGATAGKCGILNFDSATNQAICAIFPDDKRVKHNYLFWFFRAHRFHYINISRGGAQPNISQTVINETEFPCIDLSLQSNISTFLNNLEQNNVFEYSLVPEQIEKAVKNVYSVFNNTNKIIKENQNQSTYLTKLRQAILQEAIEGKLTADWRKENPVRKGDPDYDAAALLGKIQAEKEKLIKEGKIKKQKPLAPIKPEEMPFELPEGWVWTRLGVVADHNSGKTLDSGRNKGVLTKYITTSNLYWGNFILDNLREMPIDNKELDRVTAIKGDLLICEGGEAGRSAVWENDSTICFQNHIHRVRLYCNISPYYVFRNFQLLNYSGKINEYRKGMGITNLSAKSLSSIIFPLPPLAEQKAIVDRVENLLSMVDELEKQVSERKEQSEQLMQAVLREAFEGGK